MKKGLQVEEHSYSRGIFHKKILLCGPPLPPPYGGISVHLQSVKDLFEKQGNQVYHHNTLVSYRYRYLILYVCLLVFRIVRVRPDIVYYHSLTVSNSIIELHLLTLLKRVLQYRLVLVEHNCMHILSRPERFRKRLNRLIPLIDQQVLIGDSTYQSYCDVGIIPARTVSVERAFVPPTIIRAQPVPQGFNQFCATHAPVITVTSTRLAFIDGRDLYGIDMAIDVIQLIQKKFPAMGLVCLIGCIEEQSYYTTLKKRITTYALEDTLFMIHGTYALWPILKRTDVLLRPTLCDGASVSEDEAHYVGVPVVASDVCLRHIKTITYTSGSLDDCSAKLSEVLKYGSKK